ncbi:hypothetical protein [Treponema phagedenis]|uniref:hypothetical protein n=1 Tax=Treponema phagedenis TaxID=162 RepID=UPI00210DF95E|nr:hypothetical protein [Treponema phagedenis]
MFELMNFLPVFVLIAVLLTVIFTELIKKLDVKDKLKGYRVWIPFFVFRSFCVSFTVWASLLKSARCGFGERLFSD